MVIVDFLMRFLSVMYVLMHICYVEIDYKSEKNNKEKSSV